MITLGIHDGHTATACIAKDGEIIACISEERLVRKKEWGGFPSKSIEWCLQFTGLLPSEIDGVGIVGLGEPTIHKSYNKPMILKKLFYYLTFILPKSFLKSSKWVPFAQWLMSKSRSKSCHKKILQEIGINAEVKYYEHHFMHAATAHYLCPWGYEENLVITNDGSGDAVAATVNLAKGLEIDRKVTISNYNSIGEFYTRVTQFLGMKPMSHEYKVMGLAPYAKESYASKTYDFIKDWFMINSKSKIIFENNSGLWRWQYLKKFQKMFSLNHRFDNISWAAQKLVEDIQVQWVKNIIEKYKINNLVLCGGVFLNVKANNKILNVFKEKNIFIFPSGGDECLPMGAAIQKQVDLGVKEIKPLGPLYLGDEFSDDEIERELNFNTKELNYKYEKNIHKFVGSKINEGFIIGRFFGRMEWGARALGNRSIIADARRPNILKRINEAIKNRDFWMPFAPSVLDRRMTDYFDMPKNFFAPYMVMAFPSTDLGVKHLKGALHPYDLTGRPQAVKKEWNMEYYEVLESFESASNGVGGVLNTSFNLHGEAIVHTPSDAISTFLNSGLDALAIGSFYVTKKNVI